MQISDINREFVLITVKLSFSAHAIFTKTPKPAIKVYVNFACCWPALLQKRGKLLRTPSDESRGLITIVSTQKTVNQGVENV